MGCACLRPTATLSSSSLALGPVPVWQDAFAGEPSRQQAHTHCTADTLQPWEADQAPCYPRLCQALQMHQQHLRPQDLWCFWWFPEDRKKSALSSPLFNNNLHFSPYAHTQGDSSSDPVLVVGHGTPVEFELFAMTQLAQAESQFPALRRAAEAACGIVMPDTAGAGDSPHVLCGGCRRFRHPNDDGWLTPEDYYLTLLRTSGRVLVLSLMTAQCARCQGRNHRGAQQAVTAQPAAVRVLVVEDDPVCGRLATNLLRKLGFEKTVLVSSGRDALDLIAMAAAQGTPFSLVLTDVVMTGMSGLELCKAIREDGPSPAPRVLGMSGFADFAPLCTDNEGMDGFVTKPISKERLAPALAAIGLSVA